MHGTVSRMGSAGRTAGGRYGGGVYSAEIGIGGTGVHAWGLMYTGAGGCGTHVEEVPNGKAGWMLLATT